MAGREEDIKVRVARKESIALDVALFELTSLSQAPLPSFSAGSHIDVHLPGGMVRQYSLCNDPTETHRYQIAVLKDATGRGGSRAMHDSVHEGDEIRVSAPRNCFELGEISEDIILLAGGIGITPILSMAESLSAQGRSFQLNYCARSRERMAFIDHIDRSRFRTKVNFHFDDGDDGQKFRLEEVLGRGQNQSHVYVCGPKGFMDAVLSAARESGWSEYRLHYEFFNAEPVRLSTEKSFEIQLAKSGRVLCVAREQTVAEALAAHGVNIPTSCEQGVCGTCLTRVISGQPDHRDIYLSPEEQKKNDQFLPCCSRSLSSRLVLDL
ncbi:MULTISPECIES: PDR/VanB family oxidoreductase [Paraburkholderia]|uniref:PDR/VanB family oxidoreductase n=1 Tax=Paraburkholderia TaxID=1822464 RepID=UPI002AB70C3B|nr:MULTISPECIES: PDR/VanB family oxidoreductase [Paraburkholderia]